MVVLYRDEAGKNNSYRIPGFAQYHSELTLKTYEKDNQHNFIDVSIGFLYKQSILFIGLARQEAYH